MSGPGRASLVLAMVLGVGGCVDLTPPPWPDAGFPPLPDGGAPDDGVPDGGAPDLAPEAGGGDTGDAPQDMASDARDGGPPDAQPDAVEAGPDLPASTLSMGLVGHWALDESSGPKALDSTSSRNDAFIEGAPAFVSGSSNLPALDFADPGAFAFRGLDDAAWVPPVDALTPNRLTMAAWVRFESLTNRGKCGGASDALQYILFRRNPAAANGITDGVALIKQADNKLAFVLQDGNGVRDVAISTTTVQTGRWYHVTGSFDGTNGQVRIYVNGTAEGPGATHATPMAFDTAGRLWMARSGECKDMGLGVSNFDGKLAGLLDDVRIYGRVLSGREVSDLASGSD